MTRIVRKILRRVRGKRKLLKIDTSRDWLIQIKANQNAQVAWEQDKVIKRDDNFRKLQQGQARFRAEQDAEKERQAAINEVRLKNLKKARRKKNG